MNKQQQFDAVAIGGAHNGLTSAGYLSKVGLKTLILERCAVTEEIDLDAARGCRISSASYIASMLRPEIIRDLVLEPKESIR